jgi:hypothetical protein
VEFKPPGEREREGIWRALIPPQAPTTGVAFNDLARRFVLTGGEIKSAVFRYRRRAAVGSTTMSLAVAPSAAKDDNKHSILFLISVAWAKAVVPCPCPPQGGHASGVTEGLWGAGQGELV